MARSRVALVLLLLCPAILYAVSSPRTPTAPAESEAYFPTTVGTEWVYRAMNHQLDRRERLYEAIDVVSGVEEMNGAKIVTVRHLKGDDPPPLSQWSVSRVGVQARHFNRRYQPTAWRTILPATLKAGETWEESDSEDEQRSVLTVRGWELIRVEAGTYNALRLDFVSTSMKGNHSPITGSDWMAPGVGCVRLVAQSRNWMYVRELVAFKPGER